MFEQEEEFVACCSLLDFGCPSLHDDDDDEGDENVDEQFRMSELAIYENNGWIKKRKRVREID